MTNTTTNANPKLRYFLNKKLHREEGPAVYSNGDKYWYQHGKLHREDGPAAACVDGTQVWYINGVLHREDGPAITYTNGDTEWYLYGKQYTKNKFEIHVEQSITKDLFTV